MRSHSIKNLILIAGDTLLLYAGLILTLYLRYHTAPDWILINQHWIPFTAVFFVWLLFLSAFGLYDIRFMKNSKRFLYRLIRVMATNTVIAIIIFYLLPFFEIEPRRNLFLIALFATIFIFAWRMFFNLLIVRTGTSRVLFFGITKEALELADYLIKNPQLGQRPIGFMSINSEANIGGLPLPHFTHQELSHIAADYKVDTVVVLREIKENKTFVTMLFEVIPLGIAVIEFPAFYEALTGKIPLSLIGEVWFLENLIGARDRLFDFFKRMLDILLSIIIGVPTLLALPLITFGIIFSTPKDIKNYKKKRAREGDGILFFRQKRVGKNGVPFKFIKFRSQVLGAEKMSEAKEIAHDPRHYPFGKFLRRFYLDELPQIWNVLKGEMSFIGPRPERPEYVQELKKKIPFYEMRLLVPPGITGWAQVNMENDASVEDAPEKMQYDLYYIKHRSPTLDLLIVLRTIFTMMRREGR